jgi:hypothetical protein
MSGDLSPNNNISCPRIPEIIAAPAYLALSYLRHFCTQISTAQVLSSMFQGKKVVFQCKFILVMGFVVSLFSRLISSTKVTFPDEFVNVKRLKNVKV